MKRKKAHLNNDELNALIESKHKKTMKERLRNGEFNLKSKKSFDKKSFKVFTDDSEIVENNSRRTTSELLLRDENVKNSTGVKTCSKNSSEDHSSKKTSKNLTNPLKRKKAILNDDERNVPIKSKRKKTMKEKLRYGEFNLKSNDYFNKKTTRSRTDYESTLTASEDESTWTDIQHDSIKPRQIFKTKTYDSGYTISNLDASNNLPDIATESTSSANKCDGCQSVNHVEDSTLTTMRSMQNCHQ